MDFSGAAGVDAGAAEGKNPAQPRRRRRNRGDHRQCRRFACPAPRCPANGSPFRTGSVVVELRVSGLDGGHSGQQIDSNLMNALKALGFTLARPLSQVGRDARDQLHIGRLERRSRRQRHPPRGARSVARQCCRPQALERVASDVQVRRSVPGGLARMIGAGRGCRPSRRRRRSGCYRRPPRRRSSI